jgi:hypothetical protein
MFSHSQKESHNFTAYINPASGKVEFVPWNVTMLDADPKQAPIDVDYNPLITRMLKNIEWKTQRDKYVLSLIGDEKQLKDDLSWIEKTKNEARSAVFSDPDKLFLSVEFKLQIDKFMKRYTWAYQRLTKELEK